MKTHDSLIVKILIKNDKILTNSIRKINNGKYPNILEYLNSRYDDSDCMTETIRRIEYKLEDREKNLYIDFLLGFKDGSWRLWIGKIGSVTYDDDPYCNFETDDFKYAIVDALDKVEEFYYKCLWMKYERPNESEYKENA